MKIHQCEQGTTKWLELRAGIPTASEFDKIITPKKGNLSDSFERYLHELLAERIMGRPRVGAVTMWMARGTELESRARAFYEFTRDVTVDQCGFITNDEQTIGASPDGLVGDEGLVEIKCPSEHIHVAYLLSQKGSSVDMEYRVQTQGQLWISGRKWVDIISYHPEMPEALFRIERDEEFIGKLADAVTKFSKVLEATAAQMVQRGWIKPKADDPKPHPKYGEWINDDDMAWALSRSIEQAAR